MVWHGSFDEAKMKNENRTKPGTKKNCSKPNHTGCVFETCMLFHFLFEECMFIMSRISCGFKKNQDENNRSDYLELYLISI